MLCEIPSAICFISRKNSAFKKSVPLVFASLFTVYCFVMVRDTKVAAFHRDSKKDLLQHFNSAFQYSICHPCSMQRIGAAMVQTQRALGSGSPTLWKLDGK